VIALWWAACRGEPAPPPPTPVPTAEALARACEAFTQPPRVQTVAPGIHVALGYDLANTVAIETAAGLVVVDVGMTPARAAEARAAVEAVAPGQPVHTVIYTHGHLDHVGGASAWVGPDTPIRATEALARQFYARYGTLLPAERARASRQFGRHQEGACAGIGIGLDLDAAGPIGARLPTDTFSGRTAFEVGGVRFELIEAHGETEDQLFVWLPDRGVLLPGDNYYRAFPNLYTIRGSAPRPVDDWIGSLDQMRRLDADVLIPSHTAPVVGQAAVRDALRTYRDGIQFVRDAVIRGANRGERLESLVASISLPPHLAAEPALAEVYGQLDWSVRGVYGGALGWFDGRATALYPLPADEVAARTVAGMGGAEAVLAMARAADDPRWAAHLLALLEDAGAAEPEVLDPELARAYEAIAATVHNANGRNYLLEAAVERRGAARPGAAPELPDDFVDGLPLRMLFEVMASRLRADEALDVHESVVFELDDGGTARSFVVTVRRGVAEVVEGAPLPGTPEPVARLATDAGTWRRLAVDREGAAAAIASGRLTIAGSPVALRRFLGRFDRGLAPGATTLP
jgi:alkyl sulfatase BDS1-like metallo-beta-lactamase superfamily hydrolase